MTTRRSLSKLEATLNLCLILAFLLVAVFCYTFEVQRIKEYNASLEDGGDTFGEGLSLAFGLVFSVIGTAGLAVVCLILGITSIFLMKGKGMQAASVVALIAKLCAIPLYALQTVLRHTVTSKLIYVAVGLYGAVTIVMGVICFVRRGRLKDAPVDGEEPQIQAQ